MMVGESEQENGKIAVSTQVSIDSTAEQSKNAETTEKVEGRLESRKDVRDKEQKAQENVVYYYKPEDGSKGSFIYRKGKYVDGLSLVGEGKCVFKAGGEGSLTESQLKQLSQFAKTGGAVYLEQTPYDNLLKNNQSYKNEYGRQIHQYVEDNNSAATERKILIIQQYPFSSLFNSGLKVEEVVRHTNETFSSKYAVDVIFRLPHRMLTHSELTARVAVLMLVPILIIPYVGQKLKRNDRGEKNLWVVKQKESIKNARGICDHGSEESRKFIRKELNDLHTLDDLASQCDGSQESKESLIKSSNTYLASLATLKGKLPQETVHELLANKLSLYTIFLCYHSDNNTKELVNRLYNNNLDEASKNLLKDKFEALQVKLCFLNKNRSEGKSFTKTLGQKEALFFWQSKHVTMKDKINRGLFWGSIALLLMTRFIYAIIAAHQPFSASVFLMASYVALASALSTLVFFGTHGKIKAILSTMVAVPLLALTLSALYQGMLGRSFSYEGVISATIFVGMALLMPISIWLHRGFRRDEQFLKDLSNGKLGKEASGKEMIPAAKVAENLPTEGTTQADVKAQEPNNIPLKIVHSSYDEYSITGFRKVLKFISDDMHTNNKIYCELPVVVEAEQQNAQDHPVDPPGSFTADARANTAQKRTKLCNIKPQ